MDIIISWIIFAFFNYIWLALNFIYSIILRDSTKIEYFECMEYICDKIILVTKFENLNIYFKTKVMDGILGCFFKVYDIDIHQLNLRKFRNLKFLDEIPFKKCIIISYF